MRRSGLLVTVFLGMVVCPAPGALPKATAPKAAALIGTIESERQGCLLVIGGVARGRGWLSSEQAQGLARQGDEISIYDLRTGVVGRARLASDGKLGSEEEPSGWGMWGLWYDVRLDAGQRKLLARDAESPQNAPSLLAAWHSSSSPAPRWVKGAVLDSGSRVYRKIISDWLTTRGVSPRVIQTAVVDQIVKADINGDGRSEVFLAFRTPDVSYPTRRRSIATSFAYLVMRYVPRHSRRVQTVVVEDLPNSFHTVTGFCDLDDDGWAEVATMGWAVDACGTRLHHWTGRRFQEIEGWGGGV